MSRENKEDIWQNELLTVKEVAKYLRVGRVTVWRWCQQGLIPASRIGHNWRIHRNDLSRFLKRDDLSPLDPVNNNLVADNDAQENNCS